MTNENYKKERKITKFSILSIFFALLLLLGVIIGIGLSIKKISKNAHESSEFTDSINYRMRVTLSKDENDKIDDFEDAKSTIDNAASALSLFLKDIGQNNDVEYEIYKDKQDEYYGYLNANLNIKRVKNHLKGDGEKTMIEADPYLTFFNMIHNKMEIKKIKIFIELLSKNLLLLHTTLFKIYPVYTFTSSLISSFVK